MNNTSNILVLILLIFLFSCAGRVQRDYGSVIKPYDQNPKYWQYKNKPVLLLGAGDNDNLFQTEGLEAQLNKLAAAGGNYIRNTMSFRDSTDLAPFLLLENGKYDLDSWSEEYWNKFESLMKLTNERDIIVQIEVWDRFDYSQQYWEKNPFNPVNNINYSLSDSIFDILYPRHPAADLHPFFHTLKGMPLYKPNLERIRAYQEKMVDKMLSYSLNYGNVLYCMNNETSTPVEWGNYWINYIRSKAAAKGMEVFLTDMYDNFYNLSNCGRCKDLIATPEFYTFMDISQNNSRNFGQAHWDSLQVNIGLRDQYALRPVNNTKIYGGGNLGYGSGSNQDGVERFCRNIIGGCASARHHRRPAGNGLNEKAIASIKATRKLESLVNLWEMSPEMSLLSNRDPNEAYVSANKGNSYAIYYPGKGSVRLNLNGFDSSFALKWISIDTGDWYGEEAIINGGKVVEIIAPGKGNWYAVLINHS